MAKAPVAVVLLSGGLDSAVVATYALQQGYRLTALTILYGQTHHREAQAAAEVARALGIKHMAVDVSSFKAVAWYSALTSPEQFTLRQDRAVEELGRDIPITYVPLRNTFLLSLAGALLESEVLYLVERKGEAPRSIAASILLGPNAIDYSGYPDCRPEFYQQMARTLKLGSKLGAHYGVAIKLETPVIAKSKAEIVRLGMEMGAPLQYTWSCYQGGPMPCGRCDSCLLRAKGFAQAGYKDPLLARLRQAGRA